MSIRIIDVINNVRVFTDGLQGPSGASAYDIWIEQGNSGSEADFLNSLIGPPGTGGSGSASIPSGTISGSIQVIYNQISGIPTNLFSSSQQVNFNQISGSFSTSSFLQNSFTASFNSFSSSIETKVQRLESVTSSFITNSQTSSFLNNSYSSSNDLRVQRLENVTSSFAIKTEISGAFTSISSSFSDRISTYDGKTLFSSSIQVDYNSIQNKPTLIASASFALTASYISGSNSVSSSYSISASYASVAQTLIGSVQSASYSSTASYFQLPSNLISSSNQVIFGEISNIPSNIVSSSIQLTSSFDLRYEQRGTGILSSSNLFISSSQQINNLLPNLVSSSQQINSGTFSGSFNGNGSNLTGIISSSYSISASYAPSSPSISSSYAATASYFNGIIQSSSYSQTASFASNVQTIGIKIKTDDTYIIEGSKGYRHIGYNSNIIKLRSIANLAGNININVKREGLLLGNYQLSNQSSSIDSTLTNWTSSLNTNDLIEFYVSQSSTYITDITFFMDLQNR